MLAHCVPCAPQLEESGVREERPVSRSDMALEHLACLLQTRTRCCVQRHLIGERALVTSAHSRVEHRPVYRHAHFITIKEHELKFLVSGHSRFTLHMIVQNSKHNSLCSLQYRITYARWSSSRCFALDSERDVLCESESGCCCCSENGSRSWSWRVTSSTAANSSRTPCRVLQNVFLKCTSWLRSLSTFRKRAIQYTVCSIVHSPVWNSTGREERGHKKIEGMRGERAREEREREGEPGEPREADRSREKLCTWTRARERRR